MIQRLNEARKHSKCKITNREPNTACPVYEKEKTFLFNGAIYINNGVAPQMKFVFHSCVKRNSSTGNNLIVINFWSVVFPYA